MPKDTDTLVTFWIDRIFLSDLDNFLAKHNYVSRSKFIIDCMLLVKTYPFLLDANKVRNIELDHSLLLELIKSFEKIPCEFIFDSSTIMEKRLEELRKEIVSDD